MASLSGIEVVKITATPLHTRIQAHDVDKALFVDGEIIPMGIEGEFGIMNLKMLSGLLKIKPLETSVTPRMREIGGAQYVDQFEFRNGRMKSQYRLMASAHIPQQGKIGKIPWDVVVTDFSIFEDFHSFAGLYSEVDKSFGITVRDGELVCSFGQEEGTMQSGSLILGKVDGVMNNILTFPVDRFNMMLKLAKGRNAKLLMTQQSNGLLGMEIETELGIHRYYLRQVVR